MRPSGDPNRPSAPTLALLCHVSEAPPALQRRLAEPVLSARPKRKLQGQPFSPRSFPSPTRSQSTPADTAATATLRSAAEGSTARGSSAGGSLHGRRPPTSALPPQRLGRHARPCHRPCHRQPRHSRLPPVAGQQRAQQASGPERGGGDPTKVAAARAHGVRQPVPPSGVGRRRSAADPFKQPTQVVRRARAAIMAGRNVRGRQPTSATDAAVAPRGGWAAPQPK
eukprot:365617-Chlamydomonas_euryale.AAC.10